MSRHRIVGVWIGDLDRLCLRLIHPRQLCFWRWFEFDLFDHIDDLFLLIDTRSLPTECQKIPIENKEDKVCGHRYSHRPAEQNGVPRFFFGNDLDDSRLEGCLLGWTHSINNFNL